jgi:uncharacterized DUF497 family protein
MPFQWDLEKATANERKHNVSFDEASSIFGGFCLHRPDTRHDYGEQRLLAIGQDSNGVVLNVVYTLRGEDIRIISAWKASRHEREIYRTEAREAGSL